MRQVLRVTPWAALLAGLTCLAGALVAILG